jgi:hypothetical protein
MVECNLYRCDVYYALGGTIARGFASELLNSQSFYAIMLSSPDEYLIEDDWVLAVPKEYL